LLAVKPHMPCLQHILLSLLIITALFENKNNLFNLKCL
jgi:hypothetical protein